MPTESMTDIPRIVIAGTHSGCGKTTITRGIMEAFRDRGLVVQPFKVGPDFIDPSHHSLICGRPARNLDPFMMGVEGVLETVHRASRGADIAVIEGVMGMYDGLDGTELSSTAHLMKILSAPAILVVDAKGMSRSANALIKGFQSFDPGCRLAGVIFNRVGSGKHRRMIEASLDLPALGWLPWRKEITIGSRHLGLKMGFESDNSTSNAPVFEEAVDLDALEAIARSAPPLPLPRPQFSPPVHGNPVIGVAMDEAFCFYYQDNLDLIRESGGEIRFFSPIHDPLPSCDALYLGGGYPELHGEAIERSGCRDQIRKKAETGMPIYGECGGLIYLTSGIGGEGQKEYRMVGVLPAVTEMTSQIQGLGYATGTCRGRVSFLKGGEKITGHEFHYSRVRCDKDARFSIELHRGSGIQDGFDGLYVQNTLGSYMHAYFSRDFIRNFMHAAVKFNKA
jgi:cobyrinic acid a,c-diamide synthase